MMGPGSQTQQDPERRLAGLLHDLRTPLNQIIGLSEMLMEIAEEENHHDLLEGFTTVREAGLELANLLGDRAVLAVEAEVGREYWVLGDAIRASASRVLGFADLVLSEPPNPKLDSYREDLGLIRQATQNFVNAARVSGLLLKLETARHWDETGSTGRRGAGASGVSANARILIVDDESLNREVLSRRLQREGYRPTGARSGPEALQLMEDEAFDAVLLDIQMPEMNGIEVLQRLKKDARWLHLPVIMLSALTDVDRVARCIELGAEDYLPKPINAVLLRARLGACLEKKKMAEELLRTSKLQSIGVLAGGLAHDFNNMLTAVLGNLSLIQHRHKLPSDLLRGIREAEAGALRAQELTRYLLTFAEGGAPVKQEIAARTMIEDSCAFALRSGNAEAKFFLPGNLWKIEADPNQIAQAIGNIVQNGLEAMPNGGELQIGAENLSTPVRGVPQLPRGDYLCISFKDSGTGISPEHLTRIYDPFFTTKKQARGLGLAAAYSIIQRHGGDITVDSMLGFGTTVTVYLPALRPAAPPEEEIPVLPIPAPVLPQSRGENLPRKQRVLVMDDEEAIRLLAESMLSMYDYDVVATADGEAALAAHEAAIAAGQPFDLVIMDLTIPGGMGGKETIRRLREKDTTIRAIVSSGYSNDPVMANYTAHGFNAVLPKPYVVTDLIQVVSQVLVACGG